MPTLSNRREISLKKKTRPTSDKIIFISCEGQVTEEEYFDMISEMFDGVKSKIRFISVMAETLKTPLQQRTPEQISEIGKNSPLQLVQKIDNFINNEKARYEFDKHPEDEFWIIADVDHHTNSDNIDKWNKALEECEDKKYGYAISNPFFEVWLLLHHLDPTESDYNFAVTNEHSYEKTTHYMERLQNDAHAPLKDEKHIDKNHYNIVKVKDAVRRATQLHNSENDKWPKNLGSTVYLLINKILEITNK